jgi:hypothetical protein
VNGKRIRRINDMNSINIHGIDKIKQTKWEKNKRYDNSIYYTKKILIEKNHEYDNGDVEITFFSDKKQKDSK